MSEFYCNICESDHISGCACANEHNIIKDNMFYCKTCHTGLPKYCVCSLELRARHTNPTAISCKLCNGYHTVTYECTLTPTVPTKELPMFEFIQKSKTEKIYTRHITAGMLVREDDVKTSEVAPQITRIYRYRDGNWTQISGQHAYSDMNNYDSKKITVIKLLRQTSEGFMGLKEAKEFIDSIGYMWDKAKVIGREFDVIVKFATFE